MPRRRTPTAIVEVRDLKANRARTRRQRENEPRVESPVGDPPPHFNQDQINCWYEFVRLTPPGVLTSADRLAVEQAAALLALMRRDPDNFPANRHVQLRHLLSSFGMTPADRSRVQAVGPRKSENPFEHLLKEKQHPVLDKPKLQ